MKESIYLNGIVKKCVDYVYNYLGGCCDEPCSSPITQADIDDYDYSAFEEIVLDYLYNNFPDIPPRDLSFGYSTECFDIKNRNDENYTVDVIFTDATHTLAEIAEKVNNKLFEQYQIKFIK